MSQKRILVIEDNTDNLNLVCFLLEQVGYSTLQARDGRQGMDLALQEQPDMVLLDMSIPEIDGWTVAARLKANPRAASICVVALTAHILPGDRKKALDAGCDGFISKPLDVPNFASQVKGYLQTFENRE